MNTIQQNILESLGLKGLSPEKQEETMLKIGTLIFQGVIMRAFEELNEEKQAELEKILDTEPMNEASLMNFLQANIPDLDTLVAEEVEAFKKDAAETVQGAAETK